MPPNTYGWCFSVHILFCIMCTKFFFFSLSLSLFPAGVDAFVSKLFAICYEGLPHIFELVLIAYSLCFSSFPPPALALPPQQEEDYECLFYFVPSP